VVAVSDDLDERARENMGRLLLVLVGALMLNLGFQLWGILPPGDWISMLLTVYAYGTALGLFVAALVDLDLDHYGYHITGWVGFVILASTITILWLRAGTNFGTDALLFSRYSVDLLLAGRNPFAASMAPAADVYGASILHVTPQVDGTAITSLSYPAGMVWAFVPQAATGFGGLNLGETLLLAAAVVLVFLVLESPPSLALMPIVVLLGARNLLWASAGGILDVLWLVPLLIAIHYWDAGRLDRSALAYGLAAGTKQTVWPISAALLIWLWNDADDLDEFLADAIQFVRWSLAGCLALNLPFMVWDVEAWATSVFTPISSGAPMVHQGVGPTLATVAGVYALPKDYYTLLTVASVVVGLGLYALYWDRVKWTAWILPPLVLFWYYRSLNSYFTWFLPVAYYAALCALDLRRPRWAPVERLELAIAKLIVALERGQPEVPDR